MPLAPTASLTHRLVNQVLAIKPLWNWARGRARTMMIKRAEGIGVDWMGRVQELRSRHSDDDFSPLWQTDLEALRNPNLTYPAYYTTSFHAYDEGNLGWQPALEVEVAALAVHAKLWPGAGPQGDARLRQSYHDVLTYHLSQPPRAILDLGCGVGLSSETLQVSYPEAKVAGIDLSPYFLAVAQYRQHHSPSPSPITWHHGAAEHTGLPSASYDLVSACLVFHELPQSAARAIIGEARRLLRPGGHLAIMDMNPASPVYRTMPPLLKTLLKSTEPYLDEYFSLNLEATLVELGFEQPIVVCNSARHRTLLASIN
ncbi:MAG: methyltransferase domain-containing protein [Cyanobacteria bacterium REEB459]|nr:methyltransferase domain-containing protein [Cyanobacteria bacterium REEB459]